MVEQGRALELPSIVRDQAAHQAETVGMNARAGEAENDIARLDSLPGQRLGALDRSDTEASEVIIARGVHAGHFRRLAANQGAAGLPAAFGDRSDDYLRNGAV